MYPDTPPVYREPVSYLMTAAELEAAKLEFQNRREESKRFLARARRRGNTSRSRYLVTALQRLEAERMKFFFEQQHLSRTMCKAA